MLMHMVTDKVSSQKAAISPKYHKKSHLRLDFSEGLEMSLCVLINFIFFGVALPEAGQLGLVVSDPFFALSHL